MTPLPEWTRRYLGLPWREGGSSFAGVDCWGLLRLVLINECDIAVPNYSTLFPGTPPADPRGRQHWRAQVAHLMAARLQGWYAIDRRDCRDFDGLHIPYAGDYCHVAVACGPSVALHVHSAMTNVEALDLTDPRMRARAARVRFYRRTEILADPGLNRPSQNAAAEPWTAR